jgi:hypothetical protein
LEAPAVVRRVKADNDNRPDPQPAEKTAAIFTTAE